MDSRFGTILKSQWLKGLYIAIGGAFLDTILQCLQAGGISSIDYKQLITVSLIAAIAYIKVTAVSNENRQIFKK